MSHIQMANVPQISALFCITIAYSLSSNSTGRCITQMDRTASYVASSLLLLQHYCNNYPLCSSLYISCPSTTYERLLPTPHSMCLSVTGLFIQHSVLRLIRVTAHVIQFALASVCPLSLFHTPMPFGSGVTVSCMGDLRWRISQSSSATGLVPVTIVLNALSSSPNTAKQIKMKQENLQTKPKAALRTLDPAELGPCCQPVWNEAHNMMHEAQRQHYIALAFPNLYFQ